MEEKRKTSVNIDQDLWVKWNHFVLDKTGSSRKISEELKNALMEYMKKHEIKAAKDIM